MRQSCLLNVVDIAVVMVTIMSSPLSFRPGFKRHDGIACVYHLSILKHVTPNDSIRRVKDDSVLGPGAVSM